ncbi:hypothetical protein Syun_015811 [Stephania yunnanensis]|uniref:Uncharacterized protein n=1 Tax=Stephania yunnanensis TaxID=152371 RepID=A0AAP0PD62_9MAGN
MHEHITYRPERTPDAPPGSAVVLGEVPLRNSPADDKDLSFKHGGGRPEHGEDGEGVVGGHPSILLPNTICLSLRELMRHNVAIEASKEEEDNNGEEVNEEGESERGEEQEQGQVAGKSIGSNPKDVDGQVDAMPIGKDDPEEDGDEEEDEEEEENTVGEGEGVGAGGGESAGDKPVDVEEEGDDEEEGGRRRRGVW